MSDDNDKPDGRPARERLPPKKSNKTRKPQKRLLLESNDEAEDQVGYPIGQCRHRVRPCHIGETLS